MLYPSLRHLDTEIIIGKRHPTVACISTAPSDVKRASVKLRLLTGTYQLQSNRPMFNQNNIDDSCPLCKDAKDTTEHFLIECPHLHHKRADLLCKLNEALNQFRQCKRCLPLSIKPDSTAELILNISKYVKDDRKCLCNSHQLINECEFLSRKLCYDLHNERTKLLKK